MEKIDLREFLLRQPSFPEQTETDSYYLALANRLLNETRSIGLAGELSDAVRKRVALTLADYMQDIVSDAGLWRSFVDADRELYGWSVPFHELPESYIDYELNREDVRFLVWYVVAMYCEELRFIYPHDHRLLAYADGCFAILESEYDESPLPEDFNISLGLEFNDPDDHKAIYRLGTWLFMHSYLLTPAFSESLRDIVTEVSSGGEDPVAQINERLEKAMMEDPTGPLALFMPEWVYLMLERKLPPVGNKDESGQKENEGLHPYYKAFVKSTGGEVIKFFGSYEAMNRFFIEALGWEEGVEHLAQSKGAHDYTLMVTPRKGMMMAPDIARCICAEGNPLYDRDYASTHAFGLLSERGRCPGDMLCHIINNGWLPDARFPGTDDTTLVSANQDFIARCYLQLYYRGD
ncbi:MAG: DUF3843 family protein [Muribaculaceae bacterium]|nr:DUF3843 family protein [Muribaculaceae bacterium]